MFIRYVVLNNAWINWLQTTISRVREMNGARRIRRGWWRRHEYRNWFVPVLRDWLGKNIWIENEGRGGLGWESQKGETAEVVKMEMCSGQPHGAGQHDTCPLQQSPLQHKKNTIISLSLLFVPASFHNFPINMSSLFEFVSSISRTRMYHYERISPLPLSLSLSLSPLLSPSLFQSLSHSLSIYE